MNDCYCGLLGLPCECRRGPGRRPFRPCGTMAAYRRHERHGEKPCADCRAARARWWQDIGRKQHQARRQARQAVAA